MTTKRLISLLAGLLAAVAAVPPAHGQHTLGVYAGYGMGSARFYPQQETRGTWGLYTAGLSWRHYGTQRFVGGFGVDLELLQSAFSYAPYASLTEEEEDYRYYTRRINTISLPVVWQPHIYIKQRVRIFLEAAATFSYRFSSTYENEIALDNGLESWKGKYTYKTARDNRWGYGLAGGGGVAVLIRRFEVSVRARYYFGLGDILRNRTKYADNGQDGAENPFWSTPLRSPLDNLTFTVGLSYRFNKEGFDVWNVKRRKREKREERFIYQAN